MANTAFNAAHPLIGALGAAGSAFLMNRWNPATCSFFSRSLAPLPAAIFAATGILFYNATASFAQSLCDKVGAEGFLKNTTVHVLKAAHIVASAGVGFITVAGLSYVLAAKVSAVASLTLTLPGAVVVAGATLATLALYHALQSNVFANRGSTSETGDSDPGFSD